MLSGKRERGTNQQRAGRENRRGHLPRQVRVGLASLALLGFASRAVTAEGIPMPPLAPTEEGTYRARDLRTGGMLWQEDWVLTQETQDGQPIVRLEENGQGIRDSTDPTTWTLTMTIDLWGSTPKLSSTREVRDKAGYPRQVEERELDYGSGSGHVLTTDLQTGKTKSLTVRVTPQSITPELLPAVLRLLPDTRDQLMRFDLITRGGFVLGIQAKIVGRERVEVPAGTYECFKVELDPTGVYGILAGLLLPKLFMWHTVSSPHFWVKYQGPAGGPGSREIVRELIRFRTAGAGGAVRQAGPGSPAWGTR